MESQALKGLDSLLSMVQMPAGVPVGTLAIGRAGAVNAALFAAAILANKYPKVREALSRYRKVQAEAVLAQHDPRKAGRAIGSGPTPCPSRRPRPGPAPRSFP